MQKLTDVDPISFSSETARKFRISHINVSYYADSKHVNFKRLPNLGKPLFLYVPCEEQEDILGSDTRIEYCGDYIAESEIYVEIVFGSDFEVIFFRNATIT